MSNKMQNELKFIIIKNGYTQKDIAKLLNMTPKTFYSKMKKGVFGTDEVMKMIDILHIDNPCDIFLSNK